MNGHTKLDGKLARNHLKGALGDAIHALLVQHGHNLRLILRHLARFLARCSSCSLPPEPTNPAFQAPWHRLIRPRHAPDFQAAPVLWRSFLTLLLLPGLDLVKIRRSVRMLSW